MQLSKHLSDRDVRLSPLLVLASGTVLANHHNAAHGWEIITIYPCMLQLDSMWISFSYYSFALKCNNRIIQSNKIFIRMMELS